MRHYRFLLIALLLLCIIITAHCSPPLTDSSNVNIAHVDNETFEITLSVRCDILLENIDLLDPNKREIIPADGIIFSKKVDASKDYTVFDVLQRELQFANIHMEFVKTPIYDSVYIEGIHNLYEFDAGELSGWMYRVNGEYPNYGCSQYTIKAGDIIEFIYTCDLGKDIGDYIAQK